MNVTKARTIAKNYHGNQKYGSHPYTYHLEEVLKNGKSLFGAKFDVHAQVAALLHDTLEDTPATEDDLRKLGVSEESLSAIKLVTKDENLSYEGNIQTIIRSGNRRAMMVKFADNFANYSGDKSDWTEKRRIKSQAKYRKSMETLGKVLGVDVMKVLSQNG